MPISGSKLVLKDKATANQRKLVFISKDKADIFSICLARKEDILIQDISAGKIKSVIPAWITDNSNTSSFVILPTLLGKDLIAIILGTVQNERSISLNESDLRRLKIMRMHLATLQKMVEEQEIKTI